jgi:integrase
MRAYWASAGAVAAFVDAMPASDAPATVRRYVSSVATFHRAAAVANPCEPQAVKLALKRMHRERGIAQAQAAPLNDVLVARMLAADGSAVRDLRHKALLTVANTTLCRWSELVARQRADLETGSGGFGTVTIRRSKTGQEGAGEVAPITPDAMRHVKAWIAAAGVEAGPLFRRVLKGGRVAGVLDAGDVARIFKAMAGSAGLTAEEAARISGHSTRIAASQVSTACRGAMSPARKPRVTSGAGVIVVWDATGRTHIDALIPRATAAADPEIPNADPRHRQP